MLGILLGLIDFFDTDLIDYDTWCKDEGINQMQEQEGESYE